MVLTASAGAGAQEATDPHHESDAVPGMAAAPEPTGPSGSNSPPPLQPGVGTGAPAMPMPMAMMPMMGMHGMGCMGMPGMSGAGMLGMPMQGMSSGGAMQGMGMPSMMGMQPGASGAQGMTASEDPAEAALMAINRRMHREMSFPTTGDADVDFSRAMVAHHRGAIDMARLALAFGDDPEIRKVAEGVIAAQTEEIGILERWLQANQR